MLSVLLIIVALVLLYYALLPRPRGDGRPPNTTPFFAKRAADNLEAQVRQITAAQSYEIAQNNYGSNIGIAAVNQKIAEQKAIHSLQHHPEELRRMEEQKRLAHETFLLSQANLQNVINAADNFRGGPVSLETYNTIIAGRETKRTEIAAKAAEARIEIYKERQKKRDHIKFLTQAKEIEQKYGRLREDDTRKELSGGDEDTDD